MRRIYAEIFAKSGEKRLTFRPSFSIMFSEPLRTGAKGPCNTGRLCILRDREEEVKAIMYAIIENGGKQYKVSEGDVVKVEKLSAEVGAEVSFNVVMVSDGTDVKVGKDVEIIVFKYKAKKNERKKQGHRQPFTAVKIEKIVL